MNRNINVCFFFLRLIPMVPAFMAINGIGDKMPVVHIHSIEF